MGNPIQSLAAWTFISGKTGSPGHSCCMHHTTSCLKVITQDTPQDHNSHIIMSSHFLYITSASVTVAPPGRAARVTVVTECDASVR